MPLNASQIRPRAGSVHQFLTIKGVIPPSGNVLNEITRPGIDGVAFRIEASRSAPVELISIETVPSANRATALISSYRQLQGDLITLWDDFGQMTENLVVVAVDLVSLQRVLAGVGGVTRGTVVGSAAFALLTMKWTVRVGN